MVSFFQRPAQGDRLIFYVGIALKRGIHGYQIVGAVHLNSVPREEQYCNVGVMDLVSEVAQGATHCNQSKIMVDLDHLEARFPKQGLDRIGVTCRVGKLVHLRVGVVTAND